MLPTGLCAEGNNHPLIVNEVSPVILYFSFADISVGYDKFTDPLHNTSLRISCGIAKPPADKSVGTFQERIIYGLLYGIKFDKI
jgi:hypothetical protein